MESDEMRIQRLLGEKQELRQALENLIVIVEKAAADEICSAEVTAINECRVLLKQIGTN